MISNEIVEFFNRYPHLKKYFLGLRNVDTLSKTIPVNHFLICNTDVSTGPGTHWFVLFRYNQSELECFDSLGFDDTKKQSLINACTFKNISEIKINSTSVQLSTSDTCGKFCVMFIVERLHNPDMTFDELMNEIFSDDCEANEKIVQQFFEEIIDGSQ